MRGVRRSQVQCVSRQASDSPTGSSSTSISVSATAWAGSSPRSLTIRSPSALVSMRTPPRSSAPTTRCRSKDRAGSPWSMPPRCSSPQWTPPRRGVRCACWALNCISSHKVLPSICILAWPMPAPWFSRNVSKTILREGDFEMRILERNVYVGPSMYAHFPVIKLLLDLGALEQWPSGKLGAGYVDALVAALPSLHEHGCSYREPGGLIRRMREDQGTWLGHVLEHVAIELQNIAGEDVSFGKTRSTDVSGVYTVVYEYAQRDEGVAAGDLGIELLCALLPEALRPPGIVPADWNWQESRDEYIRYAQRRALGPSTASLVQAADERDIPWLRLNEQTLIQLGP